MRLCGKIPVNWFPNQVRSERRSSTRFFFPQFDRLKGPWWSRSAHACKSMTKVSFGYTPRFASMPRMAILISAIFRCPDLISVRRWRHYHCARCAFRWISWTAQTFPRIHSKDLKGVCIWYNRTIAGILNTPCLLYAIFITPKLRSQFKHALQLSKKAVPISTGTAFNMIHLAIRKWSWYQVINSWRFISNHWVVIYTSLPSKIKGCLRYRIFALFPWLSLRWLAKTG